MTPGRVSRLPVTALRVAFAGTPDFAGAALRALVASRHEVVQVFTQPDRPRGRGRQLAASAVKTAALAAALPLSQPENLSGEAVSQELKRADVLVVVAYGLILPLAILNAPRLGSVNIHASLLPRWRGAAPIQRALLAGDTQTGITIMRMDAGLDTGPILMQQSLAIGATDTSGSLHHALADLGARTLLMALEGLAKGSLQATAQPVQCATYAHKIAKAEARIDWTRSATQIDRQIRAFNPWPIAETRFEGQQLRVPEAHVDPAQPTAGDTPPGTLVAVRDDGIVVRCGAGCLVLGRVQRPGRRAVAARDFAASAAPLGKLLG